MRPFLAHQHAKYPLSVPPIYITATKNTKHKKEERLNRDQTCPVDIRGHVIYTATNFKTSAAGINFWPYHTVYRRSSPNALPYSPEKFGQLFHTTCILGVPPPSPAIAAK